MTKSFRLRQKLTERREAVLLLRFHTATPKPGCVKYCSYGKISQIVKLTLNQIQHICRSAQKSCGKRAKTADTSRRLDQMHEDFLRNPRTLELWSGKTLKERAVLFHRKFPNKKIAVTSLRKFYLRNKIKRKKVRQQKYQPGHLLADYQTRCRELLATLADVRQQ